jgi:putative phosphoesterase
MAFIGVISDTHGLLRDEALEALRGSDRIIHAGDVGGAEILEALEGIAPVCVVRGNTDHGAFGAGLSRTGVVEIPDGGPLIYVVHDIADLDLDPAAAGFSCVIFGHSHRPSVERRDGVLFFNPGAAGPRRFDLPVTVGRLGVGPGGELVPEIVDLGAE